MNEGTPQTVSLLSQTRELLRNFDLRAKKGLGQYFLVDSGALKRITRTAELVPSDVVLEIGPGTGVLTRELAQQAGWVIAIELDPRMTELLNRTLTGFSNVTVLNEDAMQINPGDIIQAEKNKFPSSIPNPQDYKLVANLPYYITSPVLRHFCEAAVKPRVIVVMVQKEVARTITARPGEMSILSVAIQFYGLPYIEGYVPAHSFFPVPKVDSAILKIDMYTQPPVEVTSTGHFFKVVRAGFCAPRKQLVNSLAQGLELSKPEAQFLLEKAGISIQRRSETLSLEEWAQLENTVAGSRT
jgi:16S rRNA (adenine1518-N6/adenine1519-N6)-dimethyltransferase